MPMYKKVEDILKILYPDTIQMDEEKREKYKNDKAFLLEFFDEFMQEYNKHLDFIDVYGEHELTDATLQICKERFDKLTIITDFVEALHEMLNRNTYISNNFEAFMDLMYFERKQEEQFRNQELDETPISLEEIYNLTEEFLSQIDDESQEMVKEFRKLVTDDKILVYLPNHTKSKYDSSAGVINYVFDGTVNTAHTLLHEFMHHFVEITSHPDNSRENVTMFNEFESIYYENAFIKFMNGRGLLKNGEDPLKAKRLQIEYSKDPENCLIMLLELCQNMNNNKKINKKTIISILKKYFPDITGEEELWKKVSDLLSQFIKEHYFVSEVITGPIMYRLCTGLAMKTNYELSTMKSIFKLAPFLKNTENDDIFMEQYNLLVKSREHETDGKITWKQIGEGTKSSFVSKPMEAIETMEAVESKIKRNEDTITREEN